MLPYILTALGRYDKMESILCNLLRGPRLRGAMGLAAPSDYQPVYGPGYEYVQLPPSSFTGTADPRKGMRNQFVTLHVPHVVRPASPYKVLVRVNPAILAYGMCPLLYLLDSGDGAVLPGAYLQLRKDLDLDSPEVEEVLPWLLRLSLLA